MLDGEEVVEEVVHLQVIIIGALRYRENCTTCYQEMLWKPAVDANTCPWVTTWAGLLISWEGYKLWFDSHCRVQISIDAPRLPDSINWDSVFTSKSWSIRYHFWGQLQIPPMCQWWEDLGNLMTACRKNFSMGLTQKSFSAGPLGLRAWIWSSKCFGTIEVGMLSSLHRTLWGFVHRFSHNCDVFHMSVKGRPRGKSADHQSLLSRAQKDA